MKSIEVRMSDGTSINIPKPECYSDCISLIKSDYFRIWGRTAGFIRMWIASWCNPAFKYLLWLRLASYRGIWYYFCLLKHNHYGNKYGMDILHSSDIGWGLYLGHGQNIIVNGNTVIGNNVSLSQMVNIGTNDAKGAIIGNDVYIAPMSCVIGNVEIGTGSIIGAGAVVNSSIPPDVTAVGVPAKVVGANKHKDYIINRWEIG